MNTCANCGKESTGLLCPKCGGTSFWCTVQTGRSPLTIASGMALAKNTAVLKCARCPEKDAKILELQRQLDTMRLEAERRG